MPRPKAKKPLSRNGASSRPTSQRKADLVEQVRLAADEFETVYVFDMVNSRTALLKQIRVEFRDDGRFIFGKTKVMQVALGRNGEEALKPNMDALGRKLTGASSSVGLFFTNLDPNTAEQRFANMKAMDYARSGFKVTKTVELKAGPIIGQPSSMLEHLRALKLPVVLRKGIIELERDHVACKAGEELTVDQAKVLKLFGVMLSEFRIRLLWRWTDGELTELEGNDDKMEEEE